MSVLDERHQVLITREQSERLEHEAARRGTSVATLVREAIDLTFPPTLPRRRNAAGAILDAEPMPAPDLDELRRELNHLDPGSAQSPRVDQYAPSRRNTSSLGPPAMPTASPSGAPGR
ncbi:MAG TPA: hypothetical protein VES40_04385, partial [Ilumatobacteraceae bacterium]|nr:hypothetical protein [Ilumatobacteraceae bacterium]